MANSDKNIIINPNTGIPLGDPNIVFSGADSNTGPQDITLSARTYNNGTLEFTGSKGILMTVNSAETGSVLTINDNTGIPSVEIRADGTVVLQPSRGNVRYRNNPFFKVENTTSSSAFAANSIATWNNISHNNGGYFNSGNRFTAPWDGIYYFECMILSNSGNRIFHNFRVNGSRVFGTYSESHSGGGSYQTNTIQMVHELRHNDYVDVEVRNYPTYGGNYANFNGFQIG